MRVVSFRDAIIWPAVSRLGFDPNVNLLKDMADACARYVNAWVRKLWDAVDFPELSKTEPRNPVNHLIPYDAATFPPVNWSSLVTYNKDSIVRDPNSTVNIYRSILNANTNNLLTNATWWILISVWDKTQTYLANAQVCDPVSGIVYVAQQTITPSSVLADSLRNLAAWQPLYSQLQANPTITSIGKILKVYLVDPSVADGPFDIPFKEYDSAFHVGYRHGTTVWVKFMSRPNQYTQTPWSATTTYNTYANTGKITDLVYDPLVTFECFASAQDGNINHPLPTTRSNNANWNWVPFPLVLCEPVWRGLFSDLLRDQGMLAEAQAEEKAAMEEFSASVGRNIMTRYDKLTDQQTGVPRYAPLVATGGS